MFFPRLRKQAKWMFLLLALVFGVGFVFFGVGGNLPGTSLGDILSNSAGTGGGPSESELRDRIEENPNNAAAYKDSRPRCSRTATRKRRSPCSRSTRRSSPTTPRP